MELIARGRLLLRRGFAAPHLQLVVFCVVGAALTAVYFVVANVGSVMLGLAPQSASGGAYLATIPLGYFAHRRITFRSARTHSIAVPRFVAASFVGVLIAWVVPYVAVHAFAVPHWAAYLAVSVLAPAISFVLMRFWVFAALRDR